MKTASRLILVFFTIVMFLGIAFMMVDNCRGFRHKRASVNRQERSKARVFDREPENWDWVTVAESISNSNGDFRIEEDGRSGDMCGIQSGGRVTAIHRTTEVVTVRYSFPRATHGTECPSCTLFEVTPEEWERLSQIYR